MRRKRIAGLTALLLLAAALMVSCGGSEEGAGEETEKTKDDGLRIFVSIQPQKYFVQRVAGEEAEVTVMVPPGKQPHTYEPSPRQVARLSEADLYFRIRVPFEEAFIDRIGRSLEELRIVDVTEGISRRHFDPGVRGEEGRTPVDPHVWLGPEQVKEMTAAVRDTLAEMCPEKAERYRENYRAFAEEIDALHGRLSQQLAPLAGETMFVFHPAFGYFADAYGLEQRAVETGGKEPSAAELERIIRRARQQGVKVIFVQPQFSEDSARRIADAIDGAVVPIDPLAENWLSNMETIAERIREGLQ